MVDHPGHPNDGNYNNPGYQKAVVIYFWTIVILGIVCFTCWVELSQ